MNKKDNGGRIMRKIIICDKNKKLIDEVKKFVDSYGFGMFDEVQVICGDVVKIHGDTPNSRIVTASNPQFSPDGGLDAVLAKKYNWNPKEFTWDDDLFYAISVDDDRHSSKEILLRLAVGVLGYSSAFVPILTGVGTGVGTLAVGVFIEIFKGILSSFRSANLSSANLSSANLRWANLSLANLSLANLSSANLSSANLSSANLSSANLSSANLSSANLSSADLRWADLRWADLSSANNLPSLYQESLSLLKNQKCKLVAYKYVTSNMKSSQNGNLEYKIDGILEEKDCNFDERELCGAGLNVATLEWCLRERASDQPIIEVEFDSKDIVAIPYNTDGKFRVKKLKVLRIVPKEELQKALEPLYPKGKTEEGK